MKSFIHLSFVTVTGLLLAGGAIAASSPKDAEGHANATAQCPGFKFRGIKGWSWTPEQYLEEIPTLRRLHMNFLMNCYGSMYTSAPGEPALNEWWKPMTKARKAAYARVIRKCRKNGITFCFAFHPQIASPRPLKTDNAEDFEQFFQHYAWAQEQGVHWFSVSLDDVSWGAHGPAAGGSAHARFVNQVLARLRAKDPSAQMIFCPVPYAGDGTEPDNRAYLEALGRELHPDVYLFWTGDAVVGPRITFKAAESYKGIVKHRLFLWDNYPVNDANPTLNLGPVSGRDARLAEIIDGYISNPLATQNEINRIPLATCADYACDPAAYDPARSLTNAITRLAKTAPQRQVLEALVAAYPGFIVTGGGTGTNPVRDNFKKLVKESDLAAANALTAKIEAILTGLNREFPKQFAATKSTVAADVAWMKGRMPTPAQ